jgi:hypothetical protein
MICVCASLIVSAPATAGEFGATFNSRLTCEYSSWYEGKVEGISPNYVTVIQVRDLLRHAPAKTVRIRSFANLNKNLSKGDHVLVHYHRKHPLWVRRSDCPASLSPGPHLMGKIDLPRREVTAAGWDYSSRMLTWFYHSGRWDARVTWKSVKPSSYAWYASLPDGKRYLIYDETDPERPIQYPAGRAPSKSAQCCSNTPVILALAGVIAVVLFFLILVLRRRSGP